MSKAEGVTESFESQVSTKTSDTILSLLKRLPAIWRTRWAAKRLVGTLPEYAGEVVTPDGDTIYGWIEGLCSTPHRRPGTPEGHQGEAWVAERFRDFGLEDVRLDPIPVTVWDGQSWSLRIGDEEIPSFYVVNTGFTGEEGITAPLAYVGTGTPEDFSSVDVAGKIVVAEVTFPVLPIGILMRLLRACYCLSDPEGTVTLGRKQRLNFARQNFLGGDSGDTAAADDVYWQAERGGAKGVCLILRDQPSNSNTHYGPYDGIMKPLPGLWVGKEDGARLRDLAASGAEATLRLCGETKDGVTHNVWGVLPGVSDEVILVTSHHDSPFAGAVEDGAGVAQVLAQAWAWARVPKEERSKTLVFVADAGHFYGSVGADTFVAEHGDLLERARILITLEHLGGKDVREAGDGYAPTGELSFTVMFTSPEPVVVASAIRALGAKPAPATASIPSDFFGPGPTSDAMGYVLGADLPVLSWIGCPYYLLDEHDTLDMVEKSALQPICETVTELVKTHMALER